MIDFISEYWQWIIGVVLVPIVVAVIGAVVKKSGRNQKVGDIHGNRNTIINGDVRMPGMPGDRGQ